MAVEQIWVSLDSHPLAVLGAAGQRPPVALVVAGALHWVGETAQAARQIRAATSGRGTGTS